MTDETLACLAIIELDVIAVRAQIEEAAVLLADIARVTAQIAHELSALERDMTRPPTNEHFSQVTASELLLGDMVREWGPVDGPWLPISLMSARHDQVRITVGSPIAAYEVVFGAQEFVEVLTPRPAAAA